MCSFNPWYPELSSRNMPVRPYVGMPALLRKRPSYVATPRYGSNGTPGHIDEVTSCATCNKSGLSGGGGLNTALPIGVILILSSAKTWTRVFCVLSTESSGRLLQLTIAPAFCGRAFVA